MKVVTDYNRPSKSEGSLSFPLKGLSISWNRPARSPTTCVWCLGMCSWVKMKTVRQASAFEIDWRLAELRRSFDYTLIHGRASGTCTEAALLGSLCDGVVLVVEANSTRRVTAQKVKERLHSANARLLGAVLSQRTFPIPQAIYRRL
jgi:hypothetical protein